jgi:anti-anti-sigma factor
VNGVHDKLMTTRLMCCDGTSVLAVDGEIDMSVVDDFSNALDGAVEGAGDTVLIDLRGVRYLDSSGCHCLVRAAQHARRRGLEYRIARVSPRAQHVLRLTGLVDLLQAPSASV